MWRFLFSPYGRVSRQTYWLNWVLPYFAITFVVVTLDRILWPVNPVTHQAPPYLRMLLSLAVLWPSIALATKRLHDRGMSGWWNLVPFAGVFLLAVASYWYYSTKMAGGDPSLGAMGAVTQIFILLAAAAVGLVTLYLAVNVLFLRGQNGDNKYGADPLGAGPVEVFS